jgi:cytidine deaminase
VNNTEKTSNSIDWEILSSSAWDCRENGFVFGNTKVGAAVLSQNQKIYVGCNVEHRFRSHDVHAEVNAITNMIAHGEKELIAILIAAEKERFTPCGSCMDWIMQFGGPDCLVAYQQNRTGKITVYKAKELMPYYPM